MSTTTDDKEDAATRKPRRTSEDIIERKAVTLAAEMIASGDGDGVEQMLETLFTVTEQTRNIR